MRLVHRLFVTSAGLFVALAALAQTGCQTTVIGCETPNSGGAAIPDPSFEEATPSWTLSTDAEIDPEEAVCTGTQALKIQLNAGLGGTEVARSAQLTGISPDKQYEISWQYRFENCSAAQLVLTMGNFTKTIHFEGTDGTWQKTSLLVTWGSMPPVIVVTPKREGGPADFQGAAFDNNLMWIDDFTIRDTTASN